jgi:ATP-dependent protease HslVU (ClpYQ) peptidase subunit
MTCIVGLKHGNQVFIGADSFGSNGWSGLVRADKKVFYNGDYLIGFTSSFRMGQLLRYGFEPPKFDGQKDLMAFMVKDFVEAARKCLKDGGYVKISDSREEGGSFLVTVAKTGRLFRIEGDFQVGESLEGFDAVGCGDDFALGSLFTTRRIKNPQTRIIQALKAAEHFSTGVRGPFHVAAY